MPPFRDRMKERAVKKTVTLPGWLNELAKHENVNFSLILQRSLKDYLGVMEPPPSYNPHQSNERASSKQARGRSRAQR